MVNKWIIHQKLKNTVIILRYRKFPEQRNDKRLKRRNPKRDFVPLIFQLIWHSIAYVVFRPVYLHSDVNYCFKSSHTLILDMVIWVSMDFYWQEHHAYCTEKEPHWQSILDISAQTSWFCKLSGVTYLHNLSHKILVSNDTQSSFLHLSRSRRFCRGFQWHNGQQLWNWNELSRH